MRASDRIVARLRRSRRPPNLVVVQDEVHERRGRDGRFHVDDKIGDCYVAVALKLSPDFIFAGLGEHCVKGDVGSVAQVGGGGIAVALRRK
jgi:hypothetical protein